VYLNLAARMEVSGPNQLWVVQYVADDYIAVLKENGMIPA
jgi:hypothetical protein